MLTRSKNVLPVGGANETQSFSQPDSGGLSVLVVPLFRTHQSSLSLTLLVCLFSSVLWGTADAESPKLFSFENPVSAIGSFLFY